MLGGESTLRSDSISKGDDGGNGDDDGENHDHDHNKIKNKSGNHHHDGNNGINIKKMATLIYCPPPGPSSCTYQGLRPPRKILGPPTIFSGAITPPRTLFADGGVLKLRLGMRVRVRVRVKFGPKLRPKFSPNYLALFRLQLLS